MDRRRFLKLGVGAGALVGLGAWARHRYLPPPVSTSLGSVDDLARALFDSLSDEARALACVPYDHPRRQFHNRGLWTGGLPVDAGTLTWEQRGLLTDLFHAGLSPVGRQRIPEQFFLSWPGVHGCDLLFCGRPGDPHWQALLTGPHLNLRIGGASAEGVAFGGPQVYGDQRGDGRQGLPGNLYRGQFEGALALFAGLDADQRRRALLPDSPQQERIEVRGRHVELPGVAVAELTAAAQSRAHVLVTDMLSPWPEPDVDYAWQCLEAHGGVGALHASWYEDGVVAGSGEPQIFRLEGPAAVLHFHGAPHVHALLNIAMDGEHPLSVGELLGQNPVALEGAAVSALFERALADQPGVDLAYFHDGSVAGSLRAGPVRAGDIWALETYEERVCRLEIPGRLLAGPLRARLTARGEPVDLDRRYVISTTGFVADEFADEVLGQIASRESGPHLRELTVEHLRRAGFPTTGR
jgi:hypothetical protein